MHAGPSPLPGITCCSRSHFAAAGRRETGEQHGDSLQRRGSLGRAPAATSDFWGSLPASASGLRRRHRSDWAPPEPARRAPADPGPPCSLLTSMRIDPHTAQVPHAGRPRRPPRRRRRRRPPAPPLLLRSRPPSRPSRCRAAWRRYGWRPGATGGAQSPAAAALAGAPRLLAGRRPAPRAARRHGMATAPPRARLQVDNGQILGFSADLSEVCDRGCHGCTSPEQQAKASTAAAGQGGAPRATASPPPVPWLPLGHPCRTIPAFTTRFTSSGALTFATWPALTACEGGAAALGRGGGRPREAAAAAPVSKAPRSAGLQRPAARRADGHPALLQPGAALSSAPPALPAPCAAGSPSPASSTCRRRWGCGAA